MASRHRTAARWTARPPRQQVSSVSLNSGILAVETRQSNSFWCMPALQGRRPTGIRTPRQARSQPTAERSSTVGVGERGHSPSDARVSRRPHSRLTAERSRKCSVVDHRRKQEHTAYHPISNMY